MSNISRLAEYRPEHYRFANQRRNDGTEWVPSPAPLAAWGHDVRTAIGYLIVIATACWALSNLAQWAEVIEKVWN